MATIQVVLAEPGKTARSAEIGTSLEELQNVVGGNIEVIYPFEEEVCIVCNDEGKFNGMRPCRAVYGDDPELIDIIFGSFFICSCEKENFGSLTEEQIERYTDLFGLPEMFILVNGKLKVIPYAP